MGAFYQTAKREYINPVVDIPADLMFQAVVLNDAYTDEVLQGIDMFRQKLAELQTLAFAQPELNQLYQQFDKAASSYENKLLDNAGLHRQIRPLLRKLGRDFAATLNQDRYKDMLTEFQRYNQWQSQVNDMVAKHPDKYTREDANLTSAYNYTVSRLYYQRKGGAGSDERNVRWIQEFDVPTNFDPGKYLEDLIAKNGGFFVQSTAGTQIKVYQDQSGRWYQVVNGKKEWISPETVDGYVQLMLKSNPEFVRSFYSREYMREFLNKVNELEAQGITDYDYIESEARKWADQEAQWKLQKYIESYSVAEQLKHSGVRYTEESRLVADVFEKQRRDQEFKRQMEMFKLSGGGVSPLLTGNMEYKPFVSTQNNINLNSVVDRISRYGKIFGKYDKTGISELSQETGIDPLTLSSLYESKNGELVFSVKKLNELVNSGSIDPQKAQQIASMYDEYNRYRNLLNSSFDNYVKTKGKQQGVDFSDFGFYTTVYENPDAKVFYVTKGNDGKYRIEYGKPTGEVVSQLSFNELYTIKNKISEAVDKATSGSTSGAAFNEYTYNSIVSDVVQQYGLPAEAANDISSYATSIVNKKEAIDKGINSNIKEIARSYTETFPIADFSNAYQNNKLFRTFSVSYLKQNQPYLVQIDTKTNLEPVNLEDKKRRSLRVGMTRGSGWQNGLLVKDITVEMKQGNKKVKVPRKKFVVQDAGSFVNWALENFSTEELEKYLIVSSGAVGKYSGNPGDYVTIQINTEALAKDGYEVIMKDDPTTVMRYTGPGMGPSQAYAMYTLKNPYLFQDISGNTWNMLSNMSFGGNDVVYDYEYIARESSRPVYTNSNPYVNFLTADGHYMKSYYDNSGNFVVEYYNKDGEPIQLRNGKTKIRYRTEYDPNLGMFRIADDQYQNLVNDVFSAANIFINYPKQTNLGLIDLSQIDLVYMPFITGGSITVKQSKTEKKPAENGKSGTSQTQSTSVTVNNNK